MLNEVFHAAGGLRDDIRPESPDLETPRWIQLAEPVDSGRGQQMDDGTVEECALRQIEVGDRVPVIEAVHIRPVLLGFGRPGIGKRGLTYLTMAALGCIERHLTVQRPREDLVEVALLAGDYRAIRQGDVDWRQLRAGAR